MKKFTIYHNPRCSKSRETLAILEEKKVSPTIVEYLKNPLSKKEIKNLLAQLEILPIEMMRTKEKSFSELGLTNESSNDTLINAMAENPMLIERPIVSDGKNAVMGRPPENVLKLLK